MIQSSADEYCYDLSTIDIPGLFLVVNDEECFFEMKEHFFPITSASDFKMFNNKYLLSNGEYELSFPIEQFEVIKPLLPF